MHRPPASPSVFRTCSPRPAILALAFVYAVLWGDSTQALAETPVEGSISVNSTWDMTGSPYHVIGDATVENGATLTILPGVQVRLDQGISIFFDTGCTLDAQGTPDSTIVFTRSGTVGHWGALAGYTAVMTLRHCLIEWGATDSFNGIFYDGVIGNVGGTSVVEDCTIQRAFLDATEFPAGTLEFRRNVILDIARQGFNAWDRCRATVEDNRIERCGGDAFDIDGFREGEFTFRNNVAIDVEDDGLDIDNWDVGTVVIGYFEAYGIADKGVSVSLNSESVILENTIVTDCAEGYTVTNNSALTVNNCVAYRCGRGFSAYQRNPPYNGGTIYVANSITWDTVQPVFIDALSQGFFQYSILDTPTPDPCEGIPGCFSFQTRNVNPNFLGPERNDFRLRYDSPAIDAGTSDGTPVTDIRGNPRVDHPGVPDTGGGFIRYYDIGAHEFDPNVAGVDPDGLGVPARGRFGLRAWPSPAFGNVTIDFELTQGRQVEVGVYDPAGRLVERLLNGPLAAGHHAVDWQASGGRAGSGLYFIRLRAGSEEEIERLVRIR